MLVNSAGIPGNSLRTIDVDDAEWNRVMGINANGLVLPLARGAAGHGRARLRPHRPARLDRRQGGQPDGCRLLGLEGRGDRAREGDRQGRRGHGVLVNAIAPAVIETPILAAISKEHVEYMLQRVPLGRMGTAAEVANLVAFLASEDLSFSTGATFDISGGRATF